MNEPDYTQSRKVLDRTVDELMQYFTPSESKEDNESEDADE